METIRDPFTRNCSSYKNGEHIRKDFYYDTMIDCDRIYYKLNDQKEDYVATAVVKKIGNDNNQNKSKFDEMSNVEKYSIEKLGVIDNYSNMGIMTV
ncbi:hypothetical protein BU595_12845, partial [Staphylococcus arlettae]